MPRGVTPVSVLREAGVTVAAGADNLQDPFNPLGRACPLETAGLMVLTTHLLPDEAYHSVSAAAATVIGRRPPSIEPGAPADLLGVRADSLRAAIAFSPDERLVFRGGRLIAPAGRSGVPG